MSEQRHLLKISVIPRSSRSIIAGRQGDLWRIKLTSAPVDNAANEALVEFLAEVLDCAKKQVALVNGFTSRKKTVEIITKLNSEQLFLKLESLIGVKF